MTKLAERIETGARPGATGTSRRNLLLAFGSSAGGAAVTFMFNLVVLPFVLRRVGWQGYGAWATVAALLAVGGLADAGIRTEIIRRVASANGKDDEDALVGSVHQGLTLLAVVAGGLWLAGVAGAPLIRRFAFPGGVAGYGAAEVDLLIRATLTLLLVSLLGNAYFGVLRGIQRGDIETLAQTIGVAAGAAGTVLGVAAGWGTWGLFAGSSAQIVVVFGVEWIGARRLMPALRPRLARLSRGTAQAYLALSGLALLSQISDVVDNQWDKLVISRFVGSEAVTAFQVGTSLVLQGKLLALLPLLPLLAAIAELRDRDGERLESLHAMLSKASFVIGAVIFSGIFVFGPAFLRLWLGPHGSTAGSVTRLFVVAGALNLISAPFSLRAFGEGWHGVAAASALVNILLNGVSSLVLTVLIGVNGAVFGSIIGTSVGVVVILVLMRRKLGPRWSGPPLKAFAVGIAVAAVTVLLGLDQPHSWISLAAAAGCFATVVGVASTAVERLPLSALRRAATPRASA